MTAPSSSLCCVCDVAPATKRGVDAPLEEDGLGNADYNNNHDFVDYDYAYKILAVHKLNDPLPLTAMKKDYGIKAAPQCLVYAPSPVIQLWGDGKISRVL